MYTTNGDKSIQHLQTINNLYKAAVDKAGGSPALTPQTFQIINIHVIQPSESRNGLQLLAVTSNGVRLYFGPIVGYGYHSSSSSSAGRPIQLVHVRLPPLNLIHPVEQAALFRPAATGYGAPKAPPSTHRPYIVSSLDASAYVNGLTVAAQAGDVEGTDYILCLAPDLTHIGNLGQTNAPPVQQPTTSYGPFSTPTNPRPPLTEHATLLTIAGRAWAIAPLPKALSSTPAGTPAPATINELATQFDEVTDQFLLLTNVGLTHLTKRRAVDWLRAALEELQNEGNVQPIVEFRDRRVVQPHLLLHVVNPMTASEGTKHVPCCLVWRVEIRTWVMLKVPKLLLSSTSRQSLLLSLSKRSMTLESVLSGLRGWSTDKV